MVRFAIAAAFALGIAACSSSSTNIDPEDPWATLYPWDDSRDDIQTTENGVKYVVIEKGDGESGYPSPADTVTVHYAGRLVSDGSEFDSSYERGEPTSFRLNQVIPGWTEGLQKMQIGDQFMFFIPSDLGYGPMGAGNGEIPPDADLMFRVELLDIEEAIVPDEDAWAKVSPWPTDSNEIIRTPTGLEYFIIDSGEPNALSPGPTDYAVVHFEGRLDDGLVADSTFIDQNPRIFPIEQLVPGWSEMLQAMHKGDHWIIRVPPHLMYGEEGYGRIPPNAVVRFEVHLEEVIPVEATEPPDQPANEPAEAQQ